MFFELRDDLGLVSGAEGRGVKDDGEFWVGFHDGVEGGDGAGGWFEGVGFCGCCVLQWRVSLSLVRVGMGAEWRTVSDWAWTGFDAGIYCLRESFLVGRPYLV